jgi:inorganic pyrophosphatase
LFDYRHDAFPSIAIRPEWQSNRFAGHPVLQLTIVFSGQREENSNPMPNYLELPVGSDSPEVINAVIESPLEGINKYEYDKQLHVFRLDRNLYSPVHYPGDYGFIPSTLGDDGDPLDVLVLVDAPSFPGCVMEVRPIGLLEMKDQGLGDEKVLAVGKGNPRYKDVWNFSEIYPHMLKEITHFFSIYKDLEGKRVEVKGWRDASFARAKVLEAQQRYLDNKAEIEVKAGDAK